MHEDELLDLVNDKDEVIGSLLRSDYYKLKSDKLGYIRAVEMFIKNDLGLLWVPVRTAHKRVAPNGLDYSMGGHVSSGETYMQSALREIEEELNLSLKPSDLELVNKFSPNDHPYFRNLYFYHSNITPKYNPIDFVGARWLSPTELMTELDSGRPAKSSLRETTEYLINLS